MNNLVAKALFYGFQRLRGERVDLYLREMEANQTLDPAELHDLQSRKLTELLQFVKTQNPFYMLKYARVTHEAGLAGVPLLTKPELRQNFDAIVTPSRRHTVSLCKTSGSTGEPLKFYRDHSVFGRTLASVYRAHRWYGLDVGAREAMLWGIPASRMLRLKMRARDFVLNRFREREYSLSPAVLEHFSNKLLRSNAQYLFGYTSMIYEFALYVRERGRSMTGLALRGVVCTAESIPEYQRRVIESVFGCPVVSEYGSAESGIISYQCPHGGHHISSDAVMVELLDDHGKAVPIGEMGRVVVTVLHSHAAPIIRYDLGDYAVMSERSCSCGVTLPLLQKIVGRTSGIIVSPSGECFHSIALYYIMKEYSDRFGDVRQFRVRQTHVDRLEFHLVTLGAPELESEPWLIEQIRLRFGSSMRVDFFHHEKLDRSASGKLRDFETDLDVDEYLSRSFRATRTLANHEPIAS